MGACGTDESLEVGSCEEMRAPWHTGEDSDLLPDPDITTITTQQHWPSSLQVNGSGGGNETWPSRGHPSRTRNQDCCVIDLSRVCIAAWPVLWRLGRVIPVHNLALIITASTNINEKRRRYAESLLRTHFPDRCTALSRLSPWFHT